MLPAIGSMIVKNMFIRKLPPILTICVTTICFVLNVGLLGLIISRFHHHCMFDMKVDTDPISSFPTLLSSGLIIYFLLIPILAIIQFWKRLEKWREYVVVIGLIGQIGAILMSIGLIFFIELLVQQAQPYLVGGSEDIWGFGQVLALSLLVIPTVERMKYAGEEAEEDGSLTNLEYWRIYTFEPFGERMRRCMFSFLNVF